MTLNFLCTLNGIFFQELGPIEEVALDFSEEEAPLLNCERKQVYPQDVQEAEDEEAGSLGKDFLYLLCGMFRISTGRLHPHPTPPPIPFQAKFTSADRIRRKPLN